MAKITEEEAIKRLKEKITTMEHGAISSNYGNDKELFQMAIEAMEFHKIAIGRYQDLIEHFGDKDAAKTILEDGNEFKKWLDRVRWNTRKVDELARKLEKEPCEDAVSRKAVLNTLFYKSDNNCEVVLNKELQDRIKALPSVRPERSKWTFINERLPESDGKYLVVEKTGRVCSYVFHKEGNSKDYWERCVIAWAPLPKLYNEIEHNLENSDQINSKNEADEIEL